MKLKVIGISKEGVKIVYHKDDVIIGYNEAIFMNGFNVYKKGDGDKWYKANDMNSFFTDFNKAREFAENAHK